MIRHEDQVGSLEAGKLADFAVLDRNPLTSAPESLAETVVQMTVVGGVATFVRAPEVVHA